MTALDVAALIASFDAGVVAAVLVQRHAARTTPTRARRRHTEQRATPTPAIGEPTP